MTKSWRVETVGGAPAALLEPTSGTGRCVRFLRSDTRAIVLGSTQPESHIDRQAAAATGTAVVRRCSGGGAVLVGPGQVVWVDVIIPVEDPLWRRDIGRAFWWLGDAWAAALTEIGRVDVDVWRGGLVRSPWSERVCFAGLGAGEVTDGGAKVVGISQRRTRAGAWFQCAVALEWRPRDLLALMALSPQARAQGEVDLAAVATGVGRRTEDVLLAAFVAHLP